MHVVLNGMNDLRLCLVQTSFKEQCPNIKDGKDILLLKHVTLIE